MKKTYSAISENATHEPIAAALAYAAFGWPIFPLHTPIFRDKRAVCSCSQSACDDVGKHPRTGHGLNDATTDHATIRRWWSKWPAANIGIPTGNISGIVVLDVDAGKGGYESLRELCDAYGQLPDTLEADTGGGGLHNVFAHPGGRIKNSRDKIGKGLDVRADGGYVVAAPSLHRSGKRYRWRQDIGTKLATLPPWLLALMRPPAPAPRVFPSHKGPRSGNDNRLARARAYIRRIPGAVAHCGGHDQTFQVAMECCRFGLSESESAAVMDEYNVRCNPPWSQKELAHKIASARQNIGDNFGCRLRERQVA